MKKSKMLAGIALVAVVCTAGYQAMATAKAEAAREAKAEAQAKAAAEAAREAKAAKRVWLKGDQQAVANGMATCFGKGCYHLM